MPRTKPPHRPEFRREAIRPVRASDVWYGVHRSLSSPLYQHLIHVAVSPVLTRLEGGDYRVPALVEVPGGVFVLG